MVKTRKVARRYTLGRSENACTLESCGAPDGALRYSQRVKPNAYALGYVLSSLRDFYCQKIVLLL